jgi:protein ImuA
MRAATALVSLLKDAGGAPGVAQVWRADELAAHDGIVPGVPSGFAALDRELPGGGWPAGALTELLLDTPGCGELSLLVPVLAQLARDGHACVWVLPCESPPAPGGAAMAAGPPVSLPCASLPYPPALAAAGIDLTRSIFVRPATARESWWAFEQSLRAAHLGAVVGWLPASAADADFRALRRLHLLASQRRALAFVLRETQAAAVPSPAALRLRLTSRDGALQVQVLKRRGRPLLDPITLQVYPPHWTAAPAAPGTPAAAPAAPPRAPAHAEPSLPTRRWSLAALFSH